MEPLTRPSRELNEEAAAKATPLPTPISQGVGTEPNTVPLPTHSFRPVADLTPRSNDLKALSHFGVGSVCEGYELLEFLGRGGMGVVYKARQPGSEQIVAIKMIRDGLLAGPEAVERFDREFRTLGRLQSIKNVIPIYHVGDCDEGPFLVMPYLAGGNLGRHLNRFLADPTSAVVALEKLARAVHQLHQCDVLHRDIKPGNILLDADGEPYLADFGLAKLLDAEQSLTLTQDRLGTPAYMAPEQTGLVPTRTSPQTDIWALGAVLYEMLTGQRPFRGDQTDESTTLLWRIVHEAPPGPRKLRTDLDAGLEAIMLKCLEKDPSHRYGSAEELADELGRWQRREKLKTRPSTPLGRFARRHRRIAAALVLLGIAGALAFALYRRSTPEAVLHALIREFEDNERITLVADKGRPRWHELAIDNHVNTAGDHGGYWRIESWEFGLVELLRDIPFDAYELKAELAHIQSDRTSSPYDGHLGIFVGHTSQSADPKTPHVYCSLFYNDIVSEERKPKPRPEDIPGNVLALKYRAYVDTGIGAPVNEYLGFGALRFTRAGAMPKFRELKLRISPTAIVGSFDGKSIKPYQRAECEPSFRAWLAKQQVKYPARMGQLGNVEELKISPRGSLGLVVSKSVIAVKSVSVTRISNPE